MTHFFYAGVVVEVVWLAGQPWARLDHRLPLCCRSQPLYRRLIPHRLAVFLHLEADLRFLGTHLLQGHYSEQVKHPSSTRH